MKIHKFLAVVTLCVLIASCSTDEPSQMDRTVFIPDYNDYNLPAYTEMGYNAFGAMIDREYFLVSGSIIPCKILYKEGKIMFMLDGTRKNSVYHTDSRMTLFFYFPFEQCSDYQDIIKLNDVNINLLSNDCRVEMSTENSEVQHLDLIKGNIYFKNAQLCLIDDVPNRVILSGEFDFQFLTGGELPVVVRYGRFDFGINNDYFFSY
ncbi:MAG: hypothetical protein LBT04_05530 [Prevotellaceae bacterium]|jgi:hypothetical protein|nr:hypothetical protein [Prevotellaceae bacterium]